MRRKPKYLDRERREARRQREFWGGAQWSPTQRKTFAARLTGITINNVTVWEESPLHDPLMKTLD